MICSKILVHRLKKKKRLFVRCLFFIAFSWYVLAFPELESCSCFTDTAHWSSVWEAVQQLLVIENTRLSHLHPPHRLTLSLRDAPGAADAPNGWEAADLQENTPFICSPTVKQLRPNRETLDYCVGSQQYTHNHARRVCEQAHARTRTHTHTLRAAHVEAIILLLVKSLLCSLLFSQARESHLLTKECWEICHPTEP